jgi:hypothetical protein
MLTPVSTPAIVGTYGLCDVCGNEPAIGIAGSLIGHVSYGYGKECLLARRVVYEAVVMMLVGCSTQSEIRDEFLPYVLATMEFYQKSWTDLWHDVATLTRHIHSPEP